MGSFAEMSATKSHEISQEAYVEDVLTQVTFHIFKKFKGRSVSFSQQSGSGRPAIAVNDINVNTAIGFREFN